MSAGFYPKLAWEGIRKNGRLYSPYILTGCVMVMMYYILSSLTESPSLEAMRGGSVLMTMLPLGCTVITVFSLLFLFYSNSFLMKQRDREFGLYNVLGMDKRHIGHIMLWESIFVAVIAIAAGLAAGVLLSKAAELGLLNLLGFDISFDLYIGVRSLRQTALIYGCIYLLLLLNTRIRLGRSKPLELLQSSHTGEKVPKYTWGFALIGLVCLAAAYWLSVSIDDPITAMFWFFIAVILVILGTYLLFMAGSVVFCRLLQKNKRYYYKPNHFVSVSSMVYRMKRNGAGLASICILLTMVLVMIASSATLYFGAEDSLRARCPNGVNIRVSFDGFDRMNDANIAQIRKTIQPHSLAGAELTGVRSCELPGMITESGMTLDLAKADAEGSLAGVSGFLVALSLEDYNRLTGGSETLAANECLVSCQRLDLRWDSFTVEQEEPLRIKKQLDRFRLCGDTGSMVTPVVYLVVADLDSWATPLKAMKSTVGEPLMVCQWRCGFDAETAEAEAAAARGITEAFLRMPDSFISYDVHSREAQRESFYDMYGSLFFLGIMLSIVFLLAAVLIIYYKQICEGYEDQARFGIMQKVGMTKKDIRKSINSQMLTVFFLPLVFAGIHLTFAFPFTQKIFLMFAFDNTLLNVLVNLGCFAACGLLYALVYKITSGIYYTIVSSGK